LLLRNFPLIFCCISILQNNTAKLQEKMDFYQGNGFFVLFGAQNGHEVLFLDDVPES
jgi:hypothetical protein